MLSMRPSQIRIQKFLAAISTTALLALGGTVGTLAISNTAAAASLPDFTDVIEEVEGSVVNIRTTESVKVRRPHSGGTDPYEMFRWFFGPDFMPGMPEPDHDRGKRSEEERTVPRGVGSGFVISDDGYILTNHHVVAKANGVFVTLTDGKEYEAEVIGTDSRTDMALIKIDAKDLTPMKIGDSADLKKGQWVLAIGSPFGLDSTVTAGIVSAINRETGDYLPFIQTDVAVNPGNSGGPLINLDGEVVGVNSQIVSRSGGFMGISLAIPIDEAMDVVEQLKETGKVTRGRIGVQISTVSDEVASALGLEETQGALVSKVESKGPAAKAGVRSGDVILEFDGKSIKHMTDLPRLVGGTAPGTKSSMKVWRKGKVQTLKVKVGEMPSDEEGSSLATPDQESSSTDALGLKVKPLPADTQQALGISQGVVVTDADGPASKAGITEGDIILMVNDQDIEDTKQYAKVVSDLSTDKAAAVLVMRDNASLWVAVTPQK